MNNSPNIVPTATTNISTTITPTISSNISTKIAHTRTTNNDLTPIPTSTTYVKPINIAPITASGIDPTNINSTLTPSHTIDIVPTILAIPLLIPYIPIYSDKYCC